MLDFSNHDSIFDSAASSRPIDGILRTTRKFRHARVAAMARVRSTQENVFSSNGTQLATTLDLRPDNVFA